MAVVLGLQWASLLGFWGVVLLLLWIKRGSDLCLTNEVFFTAGF